jgi:VanZ like protein
MQLDRLSSRAFLVTWIALILGLAPGGAVLRPILLVPAAYWTAFGGAALLVVFLARALGPAVLQALRERPRRSWAGLLALVGFAAFEMLWDGKIPVERFHFLLFGVLGIAVAARRGRGLAASVQSLVLCGIVSVADEIVQDFLASRVGDVRDVFTDLRAAAAGVLLVQLLSPRPSRSRPATILLTAAALASLVTWLWSETSWGSTIAMPGGSFFSLYGGPRLAELAQARNYVQQPIATSADLWALKDPYALEGLRRLKQRNDWVQKAQWRFALFDNAVLEAYYAPVLDAKSGRWSGTMAASVAQNAQGAGPLAPSSGASGPDRPPRLAMGLGLATALAAAGLALHRRQETAHG